jgi:tetratricopeptide (TPR) repeat protein
VNERDIFHAAIELTEPAERSAYLEKVCAGNDSLKRHVEGMLEVYPQLGAFLESPVLDLDGSASPPQSAGRFQLGQELARGGMGVVYCARDESLGRDVAVKVLHQRYLGDPLVSQRFVDEARITAQLQHPGIPPVFEVGRLDDERPYLAMKLIKGRTLEDLLKERTELASDRGRFLAVFQQVCQAVGYAHSKHILHRDLKPANVMVGAFGEVQVMDWGLAKLLPPGGGSAHEPAAGTETACGTVIQTSRERDSATLAGSMLGTPAYTAPEQAGGELDRIDERTDVFGLGAILCVILTGEPPYTGKSGEELRLMAIRGRLAEAHARLEQCGADAKLVELCRSCLSAEPEARPRDAGAVAATVADYLAGVEERARQAELERAAAEARAAEQRKRRRVELALAATVFVLLGLVGFGLWWQQRLAQQSADRAEQSQKETANALSVAQAQRAKAETAERGARAAEEAAYAELAGQQSDLAGQAAHYAKAIKILGEPPAQAVSAQLRVLYRRRGDMYLRWQKWSEAVDDYTQVITPETTDADLLSKRARAYEALENWDAAAADWSLASAGKPQGTKLVAGFARRLAAAGQGRLANAQLEKAQALYEGWLQTHLESEAIARELSQLLWDKRKKVSPTRWQALQATEMKSWGGATLTQLDDHSILAGGSNPQPDRYTVRFIIPEEMTIGSIRLEALAHDSLPGHGPGRGTAGDAPGWFSLSRWDVTAKGLGGADPPRPLRFLAAWADYSWKRAPLGLAGEWNTTWGQGRNHTSVWSLSKPITLPAGTELVSHMRFNDNPRWADQNLGRFRVSISNDPAPFDRDETYHGALELTDPWAKLAAAYALFGRNDQASRYFGKALKLADSYRARKRIVELAASFENLLVELLQRQPDEPQLQLAWARECGKRGKQLLAKKQPAQAQAELEKAREIYTRLPAMYPEPRWTVLMPAQMKSAGGATLTKLNDNSILASGKNPEKDTYTVVAPTDLPRITAFRLEALAHESLPRGGPGRVAWGNFALSDIAVTGGPLSSAAKAASLKIIDAVADHEQTNSPVAVGVNRSPGAAWRIEPQTGKNHWAVFAIEPWQPAGFAGGTQLTFTLHFGPDLNHALGRFRLSVTDEPTALQVMGLRLDLRAGVVADVNSALAKAYAQQGRAAEAAALFTEAVHLAADPDVKARIAREAVSLKGVAENLIKATTVNPDLPAADWLVLALAHARLQETAQLRAVSGKVTELLTPTDAGAALRPLLREVLIALGPNSPEATALLAAAAGKPPMALNEAIARNPDRAEAYCNRADWFAERGLWKEAGADLAAAFRRQPEALTGMRLGVVLSQTGEIERYRAHCRAMLERWASTEENIAAERTLKTALLVSDVKADAKQLARLAALAVSGDKNMDGYMWCMFAKGLHDYRTGNYADALAGCRESRRRAPESNGDQQALASKDLAVEAMALHRLGDKAGARRALAEAKSHVEAHVPGIDGGSTYDWLIAHTLYREAEGLITGNKAEQPK